MEFAIVRATIDQAAALSSIALAAKSHWGYPARWLELWREQLTIQPTKIATHEVFAAQAEDGALLGWYSLDAPATTGGIQTLDDLWVHPAAMGQGVGRHLFTHAAQQARTLGATHLAIEADPHAESFYLHMGAQRAGENVYQLEGQPRVLPVLILSLTEMSNL
jgi:GNAT superfamily N-acetyltransferase